MNGTLIPHTPIAVDFWRVRDNSQAKIFFLTHLHGDHVTGLTSSWNFPIYCSEVTAQLLVETHGVRKDLIHPLQIGSAELIYLDEARQETMTVTALDANHCPGAVMYLMEGYFGTILHTGDFRFTPDMLHSTCLRQYQGKIDTIYLDNTYCSPQCVFPSREEATNSIIRIIEQHPDHDILLAMRNLGKEDLVVKIAQHFQEWVYVPKKLYTTLEILGAPNVYDSASTEHRIRVVPFQKMSNKFVAIANTQRPTIAILPTSLYVGLSSRPYESNKSVFIVPYSDHSSFTEIRDFVAFLEPGKIIPIVGSHKGPFGEDFSDRSDMSVFKQFTRRSSHERIIVPESVQAFMSNRSVSYNVVVNKGLKRKSMGSAKPVKRVCRGITFQSPCKNTNKHETANKSDDKNQTTKQTLSFREIKISEGVSKHKSACETKAVCDINQSKHVSKNTTTTFCDDNWKSKFEGSDAKSEENDGVETLNISTGICAFRPLTPEDIERAFYRRDGSKQSDKHSEDCKTKTDKNFSSGSPPVRLNYGETQEFEPFSTSFNAASSEEDGLSVIPSAFGNVFERDNCNHYSSKMDKACKNDTVNENGVPSESVKSNLNKVQSQEEYSEDLLSDQNRRHGEIVNEKEHLIVCASDSSVVSKSGNGEQLALDESQPSQSLFSGEMPDTLTNTTAATIAAVPTEKGATTASSIVKEVKTAAATTVSSTATASTSSAAATPRSVKPVPFNSASKCHVVYYLGAKLNVQVSPSSSDYKTTNNVSESENRPEFSESCNRCRIDGDKPREEDNEMPVDELSSDSVQIIEPETEPLIVIDCSEEPVIGTGSTQLSYQGCMDLLDQSSQEISSQQLQSKEPTCLTTVSKQEPVDTISGNCTNDTNSFRQPQCGPMISEPEPVNTLSDRCTSDTNIGCVTAMTDHLYASIPKSVSAAKKTARISRTETTINVPSKTYRKIHSSRAELMPLKTLQSSAVKTGSVHKDCRSESAVSVCSSEIDTRACGDPSVDEDASCDSLLTELWEQMLNGPHDDDEINMNVRDVNEPPIRDDNETPIKDDNELPIRDDDELPISDENETPIRDDNKMHIGDDNKLPIWDDNGRPIKDDNEMLIGDDNGAPIRDDNETPIRDDNEPPFRDDNEMPISDDNENKNVSDDNGTPIRDDNETPVSDDNENKNVRDDNGTPTGDDNETPIKDDNENKNVRDDNEMPIRDDNEMPIWDDNETCIRDDNETPIRDDNETPIRDDNGKLIWDDNEMPISDDNENKNVRYDNETSMDMSDDNNACSQISQESFKTSKEILENGVCKDSDYIGSKEGSQQENSELGGSSIASSYAQDSYQTADDDLDDAKENQSPNDSNLKSMAGSHVQVRNRNLFSDLLRVESSGKDELGDKMSRNNEIRNDTSGNDEIRIEMSGNDETVNKPLGKNKASQKSPGKSEISTKLSVKDEMGNKTLGKDEKSRKSPLIDQLRNKSSGKDKVIDRSLARDEIRHMTPDKNPDLSRIEPLANWDHSKEKIVNSPSVKPSVSMNKKSDDNAISAVSSPGFKRRDIVGRTTVNSPGITTPLINRTSNFRTPNSSRFKSSVFNDSVRTTSCMSEWSSVSASKDSVMHAFLRAYKQQETLRAIYDHGSRVVQLPRYVLEGRSVRKKSLG